MQDLQKLFFSPLGKEWCLYYYVLLVIAFISLMITFFTAIMSIFSAKKLTFVGFFKNSLAPTLTSFVVYLLARLGYSICVGALQ